MSTLSSTSAASCSGHGHRVPAQPSLGPPVAAQDNIGGLFRDHGEQYIQVFKPDLPTIKLIRSIRVCRTPALGGQQFTCTTCGAVRYQYFSCGNSQCPICQGIKRIQWQEKLTHKMLKVPYCHLTFALPHELNGLARKHPKLIYGMLMRVAWKTVDSLAQKEENIGGKVGMTAVLHTWGSDLKYHVHVHCLVTFGGLKNGQWIYPKRKHKIAPFRTLCATFRRVFLKELEKAFAKGQITYHQSFEQLQQPLLQKRWVVNHQRPTANTKVIEEYLGRYVCRIAISNNRIRYDQAHQKVTILFNDYINQSTGKAAPKKTKTLDPLVAMQQILQHVLPAYFQKVSHYGLHAASTRKKVKSLIPNLLRNNGQTLRTLFQIISILLGITPFQCSHCQGTTFTITGIPNDSSYLKNILHPSPKNNKSPPQIGVGNMGSI